MERCPGSWESRNTTKPHCTTNFTQRFIGRGKTRKVAAFAQMKNSRELNSTQGLYGGSWEVGMELFMVESGGISCPVIVFFTLCGVGRVQQLGQLEYAVGRAWQLEVLRGRAWLISPLPFCLLLKNNQVMGKGAVLSLDYFC